jgi:hypothetical protein
MFLDHPVTYTLEAVNSEKPLRDAREALRLAEAMKHYAGFIGPDPTVMKKCCDRLIAFLGSNRKHQVKCLHLMLEKSGRAGYRCTNCKERVK